MELRVELGSPEVSVSLLPPLVIVQMGMALVLLMGGGLFVRGLERMAGANPGWQADGLLIP